MDDYFRSTDNCKKYTALIILAAEGDAEAVELLRGILSHMAKSMQVGALIKVSETILDFRLKEMRDTAERN